MHMRFRVEMGLARMRQWTQNHRRLSAILMGVCGVSLVLFVVFSLVVPQTIAYNYDSPSACTVSPKVLPGLFTRETNAEYTLNRPHTLAVGRVPLYAHTVCVAPERAPVQERTVTTHESLKVFSFVSKPVRVTTATYPRLQKPMPTQPIPVSKPLKLSLTAPDAVFSYRMRIGDKTAQCYAKQDDLSCDMSTLDLAHAAKYTAKLERVYKGNTIGVVVKQAIQTLTPVSIVASSLPSGGTVYDKPTQLTLATDKQIAENGKVLLVRKLADGTETRTSLAVTKAPDNKTLTIALPELARKTNYEIQLQDMHATDGSGLVESVYKVPFYVSGGPKVVRVNVGKVKVAQNSTFIITFDQPIAPTQPPAVASLTVNGAAYASTITAKDNTLIVKPAKPLPFCASFVLQLNEGVQNPAGISGDSAWKFNGRVTCMTTFSIGTSAQGRAITAYRFGEGSNPIMYVGALHGNEISSKVLLDQWVRELDDNPGLLPAGRSVVVIPAVNPDAVAARKRVNANGVDLNRNFPANDWKSAVSLPGGGQTASGGGTAPLSEPESRALANYIQAQRPRLVLSYHAVASLVEANEAGDSTQLAALYCSTSRYRNIPRSRNYFTYDTTGAMEDWMRDKLGLPALVIELSTIASNEYGRNKAAMQAMLKL